MEEKAWVASHLIYPPNVVKYIILDGERNIQEGTTTDKSTLLSNGIDEKEEETERMDYNEIRVDDANNEDIMERRQRWIQQVVDITHPSVSMTVKEDTTTILRHSTNLVEIHPNDDESIPNQVISTKKQNWDQTDIKLLLNEVNQEEEYDTFVNVDRFSQVNMVKDKLEDAALLLLSTDDEPAPLVSQSRGLRKQQTDPDDTKITVAVLKVSYTAGYELLDTILREPVEVRINGGTKILLNSKEPTASARTIFLWVMFSMIMSASACCCLLLFINRGLWEEEHTPPPQPVRRRLTHEQVRQRYPAYFFHDHSSGDEPLDDCAICLDEFSEGVQCRKLPCQHVFHGTCIARWLIERSATCPLCKIDLYEEDEESSSSSSSSSEGAAAIARSWWWGGFSFSSSGQVQESNQPFLVNPPSGPSERTTNPQLTGPWWRRRGQVQPNEPLTSDVAATTAGTVAHLHDIRQPWWGHAAAQPVSDTTAATTSATMAVEDANTTTPPPSSIRSRWFSSLTTYLTRGNIFGPRRRPTEGALTELTEPLLVESRGDTQLMTAATEAGTDVTVVPVTATEGPSSSATTPLQNVDESRLPSPIDEELAAPPPSEAAALPSQSSTAVEV